MKIICINLRKMTYIVFFTIMILFAFYPAYFSKISIIDKIDVFINLALTFVIGLLLIKEHKSNLLVLYILFYIIGSFSSTILNHGSIANAIWGNGALLFALIVGLYEGYKLNHIMFEKVVYQLMYVLAIINLISVFLFPNGMFADDRGIYDVNFFLGNYNGYIQYLLLALICGYLYNMHAFGKMTIQWYSLFGIAFLFYSKHLSVTSCFGLILILLYHIFLNRKFSRPILNLRFYTIINIVFFFNFVWNPGSTGLFAPILNLFHKDITFTGRTAVWAWAKEIFLKNPLLGIGLQNSQYIFEKSGDMQVYHAHNLYLNTLFTTGILGFWALLVMFLYVSHQVKKITNAKSRYFIEAIIGILMFMSQFEAYNIKFIFFLLMLFCLYAEYDRTVQPRRYA